VATRVVEIVEYDPAWVFAYNLEKHRILSCMACSQVQIEHIGSTAVPGLAAKPIVDILIGVRRLPDAVDCIGRLAALSYRYVPAVELIMPYRRFLKKDRNGRRTHHVHIVETSHEAWDRLLTFRDHLRAHPEVAREYQALKRRLARRYRFDVAAYTHGKSAFVLQVLRRAELSRLRRRPRRSPGFTYEVVLQAIAQTI